VLDVDDRAPASALAGGRCRLAEQLARLPAALNDRGVAPSSALNADNSAQAEAPVVGRRRSVPPKRRQVVVTGYQRAAAPPFAR
jgi:hypothetical protein